MQNPNFMPVLIYSQPTGYPQYYPMYYMPYMSNYMIPQYQNTQESDINQIISKSSDQSQFSNQNFDPNNQLNFESIKKNKNETAVENNEENQTNTESNKPKQKSGKKKINLLQKSTNIQKNYAKAIVSYACGQRVIIINTLGKKKGIEFLKIINQLKNKLKNINHIKNYTQKESYLSMFRILGNKFLKNEAVSYIYHSNIQQKSCHLKHLKMIEQNLLKC
ncbi:unnamed protein product [Paramecium primaurelia]|uniref:Uncharacterized protein n=1 Tax=Paramecium primaurelia TaxID=5886 RepID=A0A8S1KB60_PARPR|nr:unnamed protein product [Paramecium primaurelia]